MPEKAKEAKKIEEKKEKEEKKPEKAEKVEKVEKAKEPEKAKAPEAPIEKKEEKKRERKPKKKRPGVFSHYKVEKEGFKRLLPFCERCGPGYFMANHSNRFTCGHCGFTKYKPAETQSSQ